MSVPKLARLVPQVGIEADEVLHISSFGIIREGDKILLARRRRQGSTQWIIPSSLINYGEHPQDAIKRIIKGLLGAKSSNETLLDIQSYGTKHWDLCLIYEIETPAIGPLPQDVEATGYFELSNLPVDTKDDHKEVLQALRDKKII
jgi:ADP-ribose pyrophosphatase YjhB (NUDIX family)